MPDPVQVTIDNTKLIEQAVSFLTANKVYVGIPSDQTAQVGVEDGAKFNTISGERIPINLATLGYVLETGSPVKNIPARPHLVPGVEAVQDGIENYLRQGGKLALTGNLPGTEKALMAAGFTATVSVKTEINSNIQPALAQSTLDARKRAGITQEDTLVVTGQYRNAINYFLDDGQHRTIGDD